jgi:hypothetical protein
LLAGEYSPSPSLGKPIMPFQSTLGNPYLLTGINEVRVLNNFPVGGEDFIVTGSIS